MSILTNIKDLFSGKAGSGFLGGVIGGATKDIFGKLAKNLTDHVSEKIEKVTQQNPAKLIPGFGLLNQEDQQKIAYLFKKAIDDGREGKLSDLLTGAIMPEKAGEQLSTTEVKEILSKIAQGNKHSLNTVLEGLSKSSTIHRLGHELDDLAKISEEAILKTATSASFIINKIDRAAEKKAKKIKKGWFNKLAHLLHN